MKRFKLRFAPVTFSVALLAGCPGPQGNVKTATDADVAEAETVMAEEEAHGHHHEAPHGGHLIELGDHEYNLEVVFPDADGNLSLYVLGAHAEEAVAVALSDVEFEIDTEDDEIEVELTAVGETDGKASHFTAPAASLGGAEDVEDLEAHAHVTIDGTEYTGALDHDHDHEDHDHEEHGDEEHGDDDHGDEEEGGEEEGGDKE